MATSPEPESELSFRSDEEWLSSSRGSLDAINNSIRLYQGKRDLETLAAVFTGHFRMSKDVFARAPKFANPRIKSLAEENFSRAYENILAAVITVKDRPQFVIPGEIS